MSEGYPLLTTKKMAFKTMVKELLWFLRGDTNIKYLVDNNCHIWDGDAYKNYEKWYNSLINAELPKKHTMDEFINLIKTDGEFARKWGELGPIYGKQWRQWQGWMDMKNAGPNAKGSIWYDQIGMLIHQLKTNPDSRRLMVNAWNVADLQDMTLPPCHYGFQVYTRELSKDERYDLCAIQKGKMTAISEEDYTKYNIPTRAISLMWNQRSCDTFLGIPFNIASYGLLLEIIAKEVNMVPDELIGNLGDVHLYKNHIEQAKKQLKREPFDLPQLKHMKTDDFYSSLSDNFDLVTHLDNTDFVLEGYQSHPRIKAPLSN
jgi:thymidylate synthase